MVPPGSDVVAIIGGGGPEDPEDPQPAIRSNNMETVPAVTMGFFIEVISSSGSLILGHCHRDLRLVLRPYRFLGFLVLSFS
jgi:hypothetical protein